MRLIVAAISLVGLIGPAIGQTSTPPAQASISEQIRIDSFQSSRRGDNYGIASFVLSNNTDKPLTSIELNCWVNDDRAHGTKVLVWPNAGPIPLTIGRSSQTSTLVWSGRTLVLHAK